MWKQMKLSVKMTVSPGLQPSPRVGKPLSRVNSFCFGKLSGSVAGQRPIRVADHDQRQLFIVLVLDQWVRESVALLFQVCGEWRVDKERQGTEKR